MTYRQFVPCSDLVYIVPENIHPPQGRLMEIPRGGGILKAQFFKGKYGTKMEFGEGVGGSS